MNKTYVCRKLFLYYRLTELGFKPYAVKPDKYDVNKVVWLYDDCEGIRQAVNDFYKEQLGCDNNGSDKAQRIFIGK